MIITRFSIRPTPKLGESLSGFISRVAERNYTTVRRIVHYANIGYQSYVNLRNFHTIDIFPEKILDLKKLSELFGISIDKLLEMSFSSVINKFTSNYHGSIVSGTIDIDKRKYCTKCLEEYGIYKLIWQVTNIRICREHQLLLQSRCSKCNKSIPYQTNTQSAFVCSSCAEKLYSMNNLINIEDRDFLNEQYKIYNLWYHLGSKEFKLTPFNQVSKEKSICLRMLYLARDDSSNNKNSDIEVQKIINKLRNSVLSNKTAKYAFSYNVQGIINTLGKLNIDLKRLDEVAVPYTYIKTATAETKALPGPCMAPWCKSFGNQNNMVRIKHLRYCKSQCSIFSNPYVCSSCYITYGFKQPDNNWEEISQKINLIKPIIEMISEGRKLTEIRSSLQLTKRMVCQFICYLVYHKIVKFNLKKFSAHNKQVDLIYCFRKIVESRGNSLVLARRYFGWSQSDFFYYLATKEVQEYLLFKSQKDRNINFGSLEHKNERFELPKVMYEIHKLKSEGKTVTVKSIADNLGCSMHHLDSYRSLIRGERETQRQSSFTEIRELIRIRTLIYLENAFFTEKITCTKLYININFSSSWVRKYLPEEGRWIRSQVKLANKNRQEYRIKTLYPKFLEKVRSLKESGQKVNITIILQELGYSARMVQSEYPNVYKKLKNYATN